jgi:hypothetical protein
MTHDAHDASPNTVRVARAHTYAWASMAKCVMCVMRHVPAAALHDPASSRRGGMMMGDRAPWEDEMEAAEFEELLARVQAWNETATPEERLAMLKRLTKGRPKLQLDLVKFLCEGGRSYAAGGRAKAGRHWPAADVTRDDRRGLAGTSAVIAPPTAHAREAELPSAQWVGAAGERGAGKAWRSRNG